MKRCFGLILPGLFLFCGMQAVADTIVIDGKEYTGVYLRESASRYYVQVPKTGAVLSVCKEEVSPNQVRVSEDAVYRAELLAQWQSVKSAQPPSQPPRLPEHLRTPSDQSRAATQGVSTETEQSVPRLAMRGSASADRAANAPATSGMVSYVRLKNVPLGQALDGILRPQGLDYEVRNNYVYISTPERLRTEPFDRVETRFYPLSGNDTLPKIVLRQGAMYGGQGGFGGYTAGGYGGGMGGYGGGMGGYGGGMGGYGGGMGGYGGGMGGYGGGMGGFGGGGMGGFGGGMGGIRDVTVISNISDMFDTIDDRLVGEEPYYASQQRLRNR